MWRIKVRAFTLLESLLTLALTSFLILALSGGVSQSFQKVEEGLFFLSFEHLYRDTQRLSASNQETSHLLIEGQSVSASGARLQIPKTIQPSRTYQIQFDRDGGNSSLAKIRFQTADQEVHYQLYLGSGRYKKTVHDK